MEHPIGKLARRIQEWATRLREKYDLCYICEEVADTTCIGCNLRICFGCNSGFYEDVEFCTECRSLVTPEEEARMVEESKAATEF